MVPPLRYREDGVKPCLCPIWGRSGRRTRPSARPRGAPWLIIINTLGLFLRAVPFPFRCHPCDLPQHSLPVRFSPAGSCSPPRPLPPTAASSSSPTRPTATASTSASPGARNAAPMLPAPIASHGNLLPPPPIAASIPTKLPIRFRAAARNARAPGAANTSPSPASAKGDSPVESRGGLPHARPGNDVTLPREAGIGCDLGRNVPPCRGERLIMPCGSALNGRICWKYVKLPSPAGF